MTDQLLASPSPEFEDAFGGCGTTGATCGFCNRYHFDRLHGVFEDGELEKLEDLADKEPDKYWAHSDGVMIGDVAGRCYVHGCPCNKARPYEDFLWTHRLAILIYIKGRHEKERKALEPTSDALLALASAISG